MKIPNPRRYPKFITLGKSEWEIKFVKKLGRNLVGLCEPNEKIIYIKTKQSKKEILSTLIHELLHAMEFEHEIPIKHKMVYRLERAILDMLLKNF